MDSLWLEDFIALASYKNFSRAAEFRNVTQPAFSRRIKSLEEWLGVELFDRTSQGTNLTETGHEMLLLAKDLSSRLHHFRERARELGNKEQHSLQFAATYTLSFTFFPKWIRSLDSQASFEAIKLTTNSMKKCEEMLIDREADFLLCHGLENVDSLLSEDQFMYKKIGDDELIPVVGAEFFIDTKKMVETEIPFLRYSEESALGRILKEKLKSKKNCPKLDVFFESHLSPVLLSMVVENKGVAWLPKSIMENELKNGKVRILLDDEFTIPVDIRLYKSTEIKNDFSESFWESI